MNTECEERGGMPEENSDSNSGGLKGVGVILTIIALITGIAAIVRPMQNEITSSNARMTRLELRVEKQIEDLDNKIGTQLDFLNKSLEKHEQYSKDQLKGQRELLRCELEFLTKTMNRHIDEQEGYIQ